MQAVAAELAGYAGKPPPLFELRRVRKAGKSRAIAKRRRIPLLFGEESLKQFVSMLMGLRVLKQMPSGLIRKPRNFLSHTLPAALLWKAVVSFCNFSENSEVSRARVFSQTFTRARPWGAPDL